MSELPEIATLWIGGRLSWLEQLSLKSFVAAGQNITLYSYSPIPNVPDGVKIADASPIYPSEPMLKHARTGSPAIHADMWRLHMLKQTDQIWVDTDMYCYRPFDFQTETVVGWENRHKVCNAVLGLPRSSAALDALLDFYDDPYAIPPWFSAEQIAELAAEREAGSPVHMTEHPWGSTGPASVTYFMRQTGEINQALPEKAFYPLSFKERNYMILPRHNKTVRERIDDEVFGIHFWARRLKPRMQEKENNRPRPGSLLDGFIQNHDIDPDKAPIPEKKHTPNNYVDDKAMQKNIAHWIHSGEKSIDKVSREFLLDKQFIKQCMRDFPKESP